MTASELPVAARGRLLRLRCEAQRQQLAAQLAQIQRKAQHADAMLASARRFVARPAVLIGGLALLVGMRRFRRRRVRLGSLLSRGLVLFATARRIFRLIRS